MARDSLGQLKGLAIESPAVSETVSVLKHLAHASRVCAARWNASRCRLRPAERLADARRHASCRPPAETHDTFYLGVTLHP
ncbi:hypothetical protein BBJ41_29995 [Burkholderia stabilis]|nr:hypothetical protein BBJ41_29995 [Burkholderia stabilis]